MKTKILVTADDLTRSHLVEELVNDGYAKGICPYNSF